MQSITIICPTYIDLPRVKGKAKRVHLSMNVLRNLHFHLSNKAKHAVKQIVWSQLAQIDCDGLNGPVCVSIKLYKSKSHRADLSNFCSAIQKFVDDAVVEYGLLEDDNVKIIKRVVYEFGGYSENQRCEITYSEM